MMGKPPEEADDDPRVLVSPTVYTLISHHYARTYNILNNVTGGRIDLWVNEVNPNARDLPDHYSVSEVGADSRLGFYLGALKQAYKALKTGKYDVYHHMVFGYRMFNPLVITGATGDTPILIGPAEAGHDIPAQEFHVVATRSLGVDLPQPITKAAYQILQPILDHVVNPVREYLFGATLRNADRIVVVHDDAKEEYARYVDESKIEVIPYGVNMGRFPFNDTPTGPELVTVGNLIPRKGHRYLVEAMPKILEEVPETKLHVIGNGPLAEEIQEHTADLGVKQAVTFHGYVSDEELLVRLHDARAFIHPSLSEGFSHARLEAMATGTPVVGTDVGGAHDLTRDGTDGFVVPKRDPDALADAAIELLTDADRAHEMGQNARQKVERDHNYVDVGKKYLEIYRELAGSID